MANRNRRPGPPSFGQRLGKMYKRWVLDCIPNLGYAVSMDFSHRPELYKGVKGDTPKELTELQSLYGYAPNFPNDAARSMLMMPLFGKSDGNGSRNDGSMFQSSRMPVLAAAADFAENAQPTAFEMHRERTRSAIVPFRRFMQDLEGVSLNQTESRTQNIFEVAARILRNPNIAAVFGVNEEIDKGWPLESTDPDGAKLIEKITTQLTNTPYGVIMRDRFVRMQRIAEQGEDSIQIILDREKEIESMEAEDTTLDNLIRALYAWGSDLGLIGGATPQ